MSGSTDGPNRRTLTDVANRWAPLVSGASLVLVALSLALIFRHVPAGQVVRLLEGWAAGLGYWGPVVFGLVYVLAVVLLVPAAPLTLAAGAIFGLVTGLVVISLASTTGVAAALLVSRYLARDRVARRLARSPRFAALDRAVSAEGWKIVALLRLSPAVPFNLLNYLFGLTGIPFWTCVLTSWVAMLPGTLLYVYLGAVGRAGLEAAADGGHTRTPAEWALTIVGLLATLVVTLYVTRLARRAMRQHAGLSPEAERGRTAGDEPARPRGWPWGATAAWFLALALLGLAVTVQFQPDLVPRWLGIEPEAAAGQENPP